MSHAQGYYQSSVDAPIRPILETIVKDNQKMDKIAIDCGCGIGNESAYLLDHGYQVYGFDPHPIAAEKCTQRFKNESRYSFSQSDFETFNYPISDFIMANASLYFCRPDAFPQVWDAWQESLHDEGLLLVDFLGMEDEWLQMYPDMLAFTEDDLLELLRDYQILTFKEVKGVYPLRAGGEKFWHSYIVAAKKSPKP